MLHLCLFVLVLLGLPFAFDEVLDSTVLDVTPLSEFVGEANPRDPILAPDGSAFAWIDRRTVCIYSFESEETRCSDMPEDAGIVVEAYNPPLWSADSQRVFMHEDFILTMDEPDIWSLDVASGEFTNLTDDGVFGGLLRAGDAEYTVDFGMANHPVTGELYFLRLAPDGDQFSLSSARLWLMKLTADGDIEAVRDLTDDVPDSVSVPWSPAFSADGNQLVFSVFPNDWNSNPATGVSILDLTTGAVEQLADLESLREALPEWMRAAYIPGPVEAAPGGVIVWTRSGERSVPPQLPLFVDTATGEVTSLIDYSQATDRAALGALREASDISVYNIPYSGRVRPDGEAYWLVMLDTDPEMAVFEIPLPPTDAEPLLLASFDHRWFPGATVAPTWSEDGRLLVQDVLLTLEPGE